MRAIIILLVVGFAQAAYFVCDVPVECRPAHNGQEKACVKGEVDQSDDELMILCDDSNPDDPEFKSVTGCRELSHGQTCKDRKHQLLAEAEHLEKERVIRAREEEVQLRDDLRRAKDQVSQSDCFKNIVLRGPAQSASVYEMFAIRVEVSKSAEAFALAKGRRQILTRIAQSAGRALQSLGPNVEFEMPTEVGDIPSCGVLPRQRVSLTGIEPRVLTKIVEDATEPNVAGYVHVYVIGDEGNSGAKLHLDTLKHKIAQLVPVAGASSLQPHALLTPHRHDLNYPVTISDTSAGKDADFMTSLTIVSGTDCANKVGYRSPHVVPLCHRIMMEVNDRVVGTRAAAPWPQIEGIQEKLAYQLLLHRRFRAHA